MTLKTTREEKYRIYKGTKKEIGDFSIATKRSGDNGIILTKCQLILIVLS